MNDRKEFEREMRKSRRITRSLLQLLEAEDHHENDIK